MEEKENIPVLTYKRKYLLVFLCCISLIFSVLFFLITLFILRDIPIPHYAANIPYIAETITVCSLFSKINLYVNLIVSITTMCSLVFILNGKRRALLLYILSRILILINILWIDKVDKFTLSFITNFSVVLLYTFIFILLYTFLTRRQEIMNEGLGS